MTRDNGKATEIALWLRDAIDAWLFRGGSIHQVDKLAQCWLSENATKAPPSEDNAEQEGWYIIGDRP